MEKITSRRNPLCVHLKKLGSDRGYRGERGEFLCDGLKLLEEAVKSGAEVTNVLASSHLPFPLPLDTRVYFTDRGIIDTISPLKNAQNVLFTVKVPPMGGIYPAGGATAGRGTYILLDSVQDPGNVGTVIRTADALGIDGVILTGGCADVYNPKTIRATMGAVFRQKVSIVDSSVLAEMKTGGARFVGAVSGDGSETLVNLSGAIIAIGSEGRGLSDEVLSLCESIVTIPISPQCESLNAATAAAILMWEARGRSYASTSGGSALKGL